MKLINLNKQNWAGFFTYHSDQISLEEGDKVYFDMELIFEANSFKGHSTDDETRGLFDEKITVEGFIDDNKISFIVMYPFNYYVNQESQKIVIDRENEYPGCEYLGKYDPVAKKYKGYWRLLEEQEQHGLFQDDYFEIYTTGYWEMKRVY